MKKYHYIALKNHPDQNEASFVGFAERAFSSDEDAIDHFNTTYSNTGDLKVAKIIAITESKLNSTNGK